MVRMKTLLFTLSLAAAALSTTARAELYRPSVVGNTTLLGAVAGALIGGHNHDRWAEGALIGAAAGAIVGTAVDESQPRVYRRNEIAPVSEVPCAPVCTTEAPQVVYVPSAPGTRVVYVNPYPAAVIVARPIVYFGNGYRSHHRRAYEHGGWNR